MEEENKIGGWKDLMVAELTEKIKENNNFFLSDYIGLASEEVNELRRELESSSSRYMVLKNSIAKIAFDKTGLGDLKKHVSGGTGIIFSGDDILAAARILTKFSKAHEYLKLKGGYLDGNAVDQDKIKYLATLPGREELIARVVYGIKSPICGFVSVLANTLKSLIYAIQAVKEKREAA